MLYKSPIYIITQQTRKILVYSSAKGKQNIVFGWDLWSEDGLQTSYSNFQADNLPGERCTSVAEYKVNLTFTILK